MFSTIILGAGKSTRMKANKSKLLFDIAGKPIISHIIEAVRQAKCSEVICVVNRESKDLVQLLKEHKVNIAFQKKSNGTAGAAEAGSKIISYKNRKILILCGDAPFVTTQSIKSMIKKISNADACVGTVELDIPKGYGRIIRQGNKISEIVEERDSSIEQRSIREVNTCLLYTSDAADE